MNEIKNHFCYDVGSHADGCICTCDVCIKKQKEIKLKEFNEKLSKRISETYFNYR
jgi:hypothetical protein